MAFWNNVRLGQRPGRSPRLSVEQLVLSFSLLLSDFSSNKAILAMNNEAVEVINDGSLQIKVPNPRDGGRSFWPRQYYVVPLEVPPLSLSTNLRQNGIIGRRRKTRK